jgi:lipoate-protein ligase A
LGSRQPTSVVDAGRCARLGLDIAERHSGGGAVFLRPGEAVWLDIVVPRGVLAFADDVRASMRWAGTLWRDAIIGMSSTERFDSSADYTVHDEGMITTQWSELVCFAGIGPGEVLQRGRKCVGLSQRRTRAGVRIQGLAYLVEPRLSDLDVFVGPNPDVAVPTVAVVRGVDSIANRLVEALDQAMH